MQIFIVSIVKTTLPSVNSALCYTFTVASSLSLTTKLDVAGVYLQMLHLLFLLLKCNCIIILCSSCMLLFTSCCVAACELHWLLCSYCSYNCSIVAYYKCCCFYNNALSLLLLLLQGIVNTILSPSFTASLIVTPEISKAVLYLLQQSMPSCCSYC